MDIFLNFGRFTPQLGCGQYKRSFLPSNYGTKRWVKLARTAIFAC